MSKTELEELEALLEFKLEMKENVIRNQQRVLDDINWEITYLEDKVGAKRSEKFKVGQYIIYVNGDRFEIGRIKALTDTGAWVWYHTGQTGAKTRYEDMHPLINDFTILKTNLGGGE